MRCFAIATLRRMLLILYCNPTLVAFLSERLWEAGGLGMLAVCGHLGDRGKRPRGEA